MKKLINICIFAIGIFMYSNCSLLNVSAQEYYFKNNNGILFSKEEYDFLSKMYWNGYQDNMTKEDYIDFKESNIMNGEFKSKTITTNNNQTKGTTHSTANKTLKIAASCTTNCRVSVVLTWLSNPTIRSYDVIGARFSGVELQSEPVTRVESSSSAHFSNSTRKLSSGFGTSIMLPSGSGIILNQDYYVSRGGTIYASYQHARKNTTLEVSQMYNISPSGYGRVFSFYNSAIDVYDAMNGVDLSV